ncbi:hypothetical protein BLOT_008906, partial [Blomia tropicalis]
VCAPLMIAVKRHEPNNYQSTTIKSRKSLFFDTFLEKEGENRAIIFVQTRSDWTNWFELTKTDTKTRPDFDATKMFSMLYLSCSILVYTLIPLQSNFAFHGFGYREIGPHSSPNYVYFVHVYVVSRTRRRRRRRCRRRRRRQRLRQPPLVGKLTT